MDETGIGKGAILLLSLGEDAAVEVLKHLNPLEVQKLGSAMTRVKNLSQEQIDAVLGDFCNLATGRNSLLGVDAEGYARTVLHRALGEEKSTDSISRILEGSDTSGIEGLKWIDSQSVAELIKSEHPQIIATILVHLDRNQASEILGQLTEPLRNDVLLRIATLEGIQPYALRELNDVLTDLLSGGENINKSPVGGIRTAAEIINFMGSTAETSILGNLRQFDEDLAQKIMDQMLVFENLMDIDDHGIQLILREIEHDSLVVALKGATQELRDRIFRNMSNRAAEMLREDLEVMGPVRVSEVENQQKKILQVVRRLADEDRIAFTTKGEESYI
ncbi:flagellar motor switch protein FliG [Nitrosovibrio sp. Nv17]|uniref:flagellar motor switch protein FliG n=1 Tax=Nitrosovibrio sp. Nv17 TaxID=1855339 RepID=UPI0009087375|nr:flagellar motor switch protein FliG [Nitrosovibrio sp. Nv17]SFW14485.1 flagellar motor switch protein FliG [Nitrosovibrio sp. Nv17]